MHTYNTLPCKHSPFWEVNCLRFAFLSHFSNISCLLAIHTWHGFYIMWRSLQLLQELSCQNLCFLVRKCLVDEISVRIQQFELLSKSTNAGNVFKYTKYKIIFHICLICSLIVIYTRSGFNSVFDNEWLTTQIYALFCQTSTYISHWHLAQCEHPPLQLPD